MSSQPESSAQSGEGSVSEGAMGHGPGAVESATSPLNKTTADDPGMGPTGDSWRCATERERGGGEAAAVAFPRVKPKMTRGRVKIDIDFIQDRFRRRTTFSKRKKYIIKKAKELATLTGSQVLVLACSETGLVHKWSTPMFQPVINSEDGKALIQTCLESGRSAAQSESPAAAGSKELAVAFQLSETEGLQGHSEDASPVGTTTTSTPAPMRYYHHMQMPLNVMPPDEPPIVSFSEVHMAWQRDGQHAFYMHDSLFPVQTAPAFPGSSLMVTGQQQQK